MIDDALATGESLLWTGKPSHAVAAREYGQRIAFLALALIVSVGVRQLPPTSTAAANAATAACLVLLAVAAGLIAALYLEVAGIEYDITNQRLRRWGGVLSRRMEEIELYRVRETSLIAPWFQRLAGVSSVVVAFTDSDGHATMLLAAIPDADDVRNLLRTAVEASRSAHQVRAFESE